MAELRVGATARELIPGSPDEIDRLASRMSVLGTGLTGAADQLRAIDAGEWIGDAAEAFKAVVGQEPDKYDHAGGAFQLGSRVTRSYASVLRDAQGRAAQAIDLFEAAEARTAGWRNDVDRYNQAQRAAEASPDDEAVVARAESMSAPGGDPGAGDRERAHAMLAAARDDVRAEADRASSALEQAWQDAPNEPGLFEKALDWGGEFVGGVWDSVWGTAEFLWSVSTVRMLIDPEGWREDVQALGQGLWYGITHPVEFGKILLDWDTWRENPARALGRLVPDLLLTLATGGGAAAARTVRGVSTLRRLGSHADEVSDLARLSDRVEDLGDLAQYSGRLPEHLGPSRLPTDGRVARLTDGYEPMGGLSPEDFVRRHWDPDARGGRGGWASGRPDGTGYPPNDGFTPGTTVDYQPSRGEIIDRFGSPRGRYTSPDGTPLAERALPPDSLNPLEPGFGYHRYRVERWDDGAGGVQAGEVAPAFEQPGGGIQHRFDRPIQDLLDEGYLSEVTDRSAVWPGPVLMEGGQANEQLETAGSSAE